MATLYSGPGKVYMSSIALQPEGENGPIKIDVKEETAPISSAMFGYLGEQVVNQEADITLTPFDNWGNLALLYPSFLGVTIGASTGALQVGSLAHTGTKVPAKVWTPDGRIYHAVRAAVVGHPSLHLGIGKALFGEARIACIADSTKSLGDSSAIFNGNAITESAGSDPGGTFVMSDFVRGAWTGAWGAVTGFTAIEAEDEWTIEVNAKYSPLKVQGLTRAMKLDSVQFMAKVRPYGPTHTQILGIVGGHTAGQRLGSADLVLTGPSSKTITLKNVGLRGAGFEFGGTRLGTGEIGFVTGATFTAGAPDPLLIFS